MLQNYHFNYYVLSPLIQAFGRTVLSFFYALAFFLALMVPFEQVVWAKTAAGVLFEHSSSVGNGSQKRSNDVLFQKEQTWNAWKLPHHQIFKSRRTGVPLMANGEAALPSNAHNFHGAWNAAVDPRTGTSSFNISLLTVLYDLGQKKWSLDLSYKGTPSPEGPDTFGLGSQWTWNIGSEHLSTSNVSGHLTTDIVTGDGHALTMQRDRDAQGHFSWHPLRHKLDDVTVTGHPGDWTVALSSGSREHIFNGYEDWEESRDGKRIWFYYDHTGGADKCRHLVYMCSHSLTPEQVKGTTNACGHDGIWLTYQGRNVKVHGNQTIELHGIIKNGIRELDSIVLPSLSSQGVSNAGKSALLSFSYDDQGNRPWLLREVKYPTGESTTFLYNTESDRTNFKTPGLSTSAPGVKLSVVTEQITHESNGVLPEKHRWYRYQGRHANQHNYLGYQGTNLLIPGKDNLLDRSDNYTYSVTMDNGLTSTTTTYNKFHLPLRVVQRDDIHNSVIAQGDKVYPQWKDRTLSQMPSNYSLPVQSVKVLGSMTEKGRSDATPARVIISAKYNASGQLIWRRDAYGKETFIQYCPLSGDIHCPAMDPLWPDFTKPEKVLVIPAKIMPAGSYPMVSMAERVNPEHAREVIFNYKAFPSVRPAAVLRGKRKSPEKAQGFHFWQVKEKIAGVIPLIAVNDLKPGANLPELGQDGLLSKVVFQYDTRQQSLAYGKLDRLTIIKPPSLETPVINQRFLRMSQDVRSSDSLTFNVARNIDTRSGTRTVSFFLNSTVPVTEDGNRGLLEKNAQVLIGSDTFSMINGNKLSSSDPMNKRHTLWLYDQWQRPTEKIITHVDTGKSQRVSWRYIVSSHENAMIQTGVNVQNKTVFSGRFVLSTWHRYKSDFKKPVEGDAYWIKDSETTYTRAGKPRSKTVWHAADAFGKNRGEPVSLTTTYGYDSLNRPVWTKTPDGVIHVTVRDDARMLIVNYEVATRSHGKSVELLGSAMNVVRSNILGRPVATYVFPTDVGAMRHGDLLYPEAIRKRLRSLESKIAPKHIQTLDSFGLLPLAGQGGLLNVVDDAIAAGVWMRHTTTKYDGYGREVQHTESNGAVVRWSWNNGDLVAITAPDGSVIHDKYDIQGNRIARCVQPVGDEVCHTLGTRGFGPAGKLLWQADEMGHMSRYTYDADGRKTRAVLPSANGKGQGHVITWRYNSLGPVEEDIDGKPEVLYAWDENTWKLTDHEDHISHLHYDYDKNTGALVSITRSAPVRLSRIEGTHYPSGVTRFKWDRYGSLVSVTDSLGYRYRSYHDNLGRVVESYVRLPGEISDTSIKSVTYDGFGRPDRIINGIGTVRLITYGEMGHVVSTKDFQDNKAVLGLAYHWDPDSQNLASMTREEGDKVATQYYTYDINNNLTSMRCGTVNNNDKGLSLCPHETALAYSGLTRPPVITSQTYQFDKWNNIRSVHEKVVTASGKSLEKDSLYTYMGESGEKKYDPHRMTAFSTCWSNQSFNIKPSVIVWDQLGRIIVDADGNRLHYNALGQQDRFVNRRTGDITRYYYDSDGHQAVERSFNSKNQPLQSPLYLLYQGNQVVAQVQADAKGHVHHSVELGGGVRSEDGKISQWYLNDYKGDVIKGLDAGGKAVRNMTYSPYGMRYDLLDHEVQALPVALALDSVRPWWQSRSPGFDHQIRDLATGYQFLGGGYRAYNPVYRHFMSKDSYSPFTKIDGYGFVDNNPVMKTDPTGHLPQWINYVMGSVWIAAGILACFLAPVAVSGAALSLSAGVAAGVNTLSVVNTVASGLLCVASGSLEIASAAHPFNKTLAYINNGVSMAYSVLFMAMSAMAVVSGLANIGYTISNLVEIRQLTSTGATLKRVSNSLIVASGVAGLLSGGVSMAADTGGLVALDHPDFASSNGFLPIIRYLEYTATGLMLTSMAMGVAPLFIELRDLSQRSRFARFYRAMKNRKRLDMTWNNVWAETNRPEFVRGPHGKGMINNALNLDTLAYENRALLRGRMGDSGVFSDLLSQQQVAADMAGQSGKSVTLATNTQLKRMANDITGSVGNNGEGTVYYSMREVNGVFQWMRMRVKVDGSVGNWEPVNLSRF